MGFDVPASTGAHSPLLEEGSIATDAHRVFWGGLGKSLQEDDFLCSVADDRDMKSLRALGFKESLDDMHRKLSQQVRRCFEELRSEQCAKTEFLQQMSEEAMIKIRADTSKLQAQVESMVPEQTDKRSAEVAQIQYFQESCTAATKEARVVLQEAVRLKGELALLLVEHQEKQEAEMSKLKSNIKEMDTNLHIILPDQLGKQVELERRMQRLEEIDSSAREQEKGALRDAIQLKGDLQDLMDSRQQEERHMLNDVIALKDEMNDVLIQRNEKEVALQDDIAKLKSELEVFMDKRHTDEINVLDDVVALKGELNGIINQQREERNLLDDMAKLKADLETLLNASIDVRLRKRRLVSAVTKSSGIQHLQTFQDELAPNVVTQASVDASMHVSTPCSSNVNIGKSPIFPTFQRRSFSDSVAMGTAYTDSPKGTPMVNTQRLPGKEGRFFSDGIATISDPLNRPLLKECEVRRQRSGSEQTLLGVARISSAGAPSKVTHAQEDPAGPSCNSGLSQIALHLPKHELPDHLKHFARILGPLFSAERVEKTLRAAKATRHGLPDPRVIKCESMAAQTDCNDVCAQMNCNLVYSRLRVGMALESDDDVDQVIEDTLQIIDAHAKKPLEDQL